MAVDDAFELTQLELTLQNWAEGRDLPAAAIQQLETELLADELRAKAFGITSENVHQVLWTRLHLFQAVYPELLQLCHSVVATSIGTVWHLWLPLAIQLAEMRQTLKRPLVQGVLGGQGTGKTTLGLALTVILKHLGYRTLSLSLDDLYKTYAERLLLREKDPRLVWRGPPGTHDIELGIQVLEQLRQANYPVIVPRFDKSAYAGAGDRTASERVEAGEIVLFEGWFVGAQPIDSNAFETAPPPIVTTADRAFAQEMNAQLKNYLPLWHYLDRLLVLSLSDYRLSQQWRRQAEHELIKAGKSGMSDAEIDQFVEYFWKALHPDLFVLPLTQNPGVTDLVIEIQPDHSPGAIYRPADLAGRC